MLRKKVILELSAEFIFLLFCFFARSFACHKDCTDQVDLEESKTQKNLRISGSNHGRETAAGVERKATRRRRQKGEQGSGGQEEKEVWLRAGRGGGAKTRADKYITRKRGRRVVRKKRSRKSKKKEEEERGGGRREGEVLGKYIKENGKFYEKIHLLKLKIQQKMHQWKWENSAQKIHQWTRKIQGKLH